METIEFINKMLIKELEYIADLITGNNQEDIDERDRYIKRINNEIQKLHVKLYNSDKMINEMIAQSEKNLRKISKYEEHEANCKKNIESKKEGWKKEKERLNKLLIQKNREILCRNDIIKEQRGKLDVLNKKNKMSWKTMMALKEVSKSKQDMQKEIDDLMELLDDKDNEILRLSKEKETVLKKNKQIMELVNNIKKGF